MKVISAISEELVRPPAGSLSQFGAAARGLSRRHGGVSTGTRRVWPVRDVGPLTDDYSLTSDWDNQWLTGGLETDVIAEAHLDVSSIYNGIQRFAAERGERLARQSALLEESQRG